jgi:hypothetical protein
MLKNKTETKLKTLGFFEFLRPGDYPILHITDLFFLLPQLFFRSHFFVIYTQLSKYIHKTFFLDYAAQNRYQRKVYCYYAGS